MKLWSGSSMCGVLNSFTADKGFRSIMNGVSNSMRLETARWERSFQFPDFKVPYVDGQAVRSDVGTTAGGNDEVIWVGNAEKHAGNGSSTNDPTIIFFGPIVHEDTQAYCDWLLQLPIFKEVGVIPVSQDDFLALTRQLYQEGMWGWTEGGYPPMGTRPILNFVMHMEECWNVSSITSYVGTATNPYSAASFVSSTPPGYSEWADPWVSVVDFNNARGISCDSDPAISGELTIESTFQKDNDSSTEYLWDGRFDGGTWMQMKKNGWDINWNNRNEFNLTAGYTIGDKMHIVATAKQSTNLSEIWLNNGVNAAIYNSSTANGALCKVGDEWKIGCRNLNTDFFDGTMAMHRVWDYKMDTVQADILYLHEKPQLNET
tara:strand:- start:33 stop:1157 length:1125 start_codon:yes stop_codon:yes gene_type:complete